MNYMLYFLISIICINYSLGNIPEIQVKYSDLKFYQNTVKIPAKKMHYQQFYI